MRAEKFWSDAFREDAKRPSTLFGMPKIQLKEFQNVVDEVLKDKKGGANKVKVLTVSPWRAYKQEDGEYRWGQDAKIIMTMPNGLSFPLWVESSVFKQGNKYYLVIINGSHVAADQLGDPLLYGFYRMERSSQ